MTQTVVKRSTISFVLQLVFRTGAFTTIVAAALVFAIGLKRFILFRQFVKTATLLRRSTGGPLADRNIIPLYYDVLTNHRHRLNEWLLEMTKKYGRTWHVAHFLIVTTPENVQHILKDNFENYPKGDQFIFVFQDLLGDGIFNSNGERWYTQRKTASKIFSRKTFSTFMAETFHHHGKILLEILGKSANGKEVVDLQDLFYRFTLDSIGQIGFGVELDILRKGKIPFSEAFDKSQAHIINRIINPFWGFTSFFSPEEYRQKERLKLIADFTQKIIDERRREGVENRMDIISYFLEKVDDEGKPYSDSYLRDIVMNFLIAGRDTTAVTLSWTFYLLSNNPEVEKKLLEEIDQTLNGKTPTYDDIDTRLPYLHAVVREVLRLYPPVPKDIKNALNDDHLPDGTFVPKGSIVVFSPYIMGRLEEMYENPLKFDPMRWFEPENAKKTAFQYPVFQAGPRTCLGLQMAYFEAELVTVMILQNYLIRVTPGTKAYPAESLTMPIVGGLPVTITKRDEFYFKSS